MQTEQLLCWSDMTDIKYSTRSGSNEEEQWFKRHYTYVAANKACIGLLKA